VTQPETERVDASAAPVRERGMRTRAGNAMGRTRAAVLDGAVRAVEKYGARKTTMGDIATVSGVAKATLYNHFRTKDAVYAAVLDAGVRELADECVTVAGDDLAGALALAAERVSGHAALRRIAVDEPAVIAALQSVGDLGIWAVARERTAAVLAAAGRSGDRAQAETVLRWVVSHVGAPSTHDTIESGARVLAAGTVSAVVTSAEAPSAAG
jgi:AcrR family transcriptional regulator